MMRDENPIRTLEDYSKPSHGGYRNTIELLVWNNMVPLRSDTIWLVQSGCSFHGLRSEDPNQHLEEFLKLVDSLNLDGGNWERTTLEKVLIREEAKFPVTENVNSISLANVEEDMSDKIDVATGNDIEKPIETEMRMQVKEAKKKNEARKEEMIEVPSSQPVEYYLKHSINKKLIEGIVESKTKETIHPKTPFLTTAKAVIKFDKGTITLISGKSKISFHRIPESLCKINRGVKNTIDPIAHTMTINRLVLEWEERIKVHLEREMKFDQWKRNFFKSKHPALVKVEGEMDDEGEVINPAFVCIIVDTSRETRVRRKDTIGYEDLTTKNEHYALWEVIEFGDSYQAPLEETGKGSTSESSAKKKGRTVTITTEDMQKRRNNVKARTTLLLALPDEHQLRFSKYETAQKLWGAILKTFGENSETLEQTFNRLQAIIKYKDITQIDEDDIEEMDIKWNMALLSMRADRFWKKTGKKITIQESDVAGFNKSKVECSNCHKMGHFARECRAPRSQDRGRRESYKQGPKEEEQALKALMAIDGI
uniref:Ribonuclease H-like domain-containing protein n=1 Tax=Tanacetum cinerariifolium TaxID=118510 RepID=A0A6L2MKB0_TANCI|nr:ribonuclease H-like domain-containing protein [Tanacetum cinerariifolium]